MVMISRFSSKTVMSVPSKATRCGSFCDLNLKNTDDAMAHQAKQEKRLILLVPLELATETGLKVNAKHPAPRSSKEKQTICACCYPPHREILL